MPYAIITGASQGTGKAIAEKLLREGFSIAVCARNHDKLQAVAEEWKAQYPAAHILALPADLTLPADVQVFAAAVLAAFPAIDVLVNNAGAYQPASIADGPDGVLENMMSTNLYSAYRITRSILPVMRTAAKGHIFNICSVASLKPIAGAGAYSMSKYALLGFSDNLREELKNDNIKVTSICPGAIFTPSWHGSGVLPQRILEAGDIADILYAAYTLSPQASVDTIVVRPVKGDL